MTFGYLAAKLGRRLVLAAAIAGAAAIASAPRPADAWVSPGAAAAIGLGSFALGTMLGAGANPYYSPYYPYGYYAPPPAYYYPPPRYYYPPRRCWSPYYGRYYPC